jgi:Recombination endonuclease VII
MTPEQWDEMVAAQEGACYLCDEPLDLEAPGKVHVDHDHACCRGERTCGRCIRGLACDLCNRGIGAFGDDPDRMERVAAKLRAASAAADRRSADGQELPLNVARLRRKESALWLVWSPLGGSTMCPLRPEC